MGSRKNHTVCRAEVHDLAGLILRDCLQLKDQGPKCTVATILSILFFAAARMSSIFDACRQLKRSPGDQAVHNALGAMLPEELEDLEERLNAGLVARLPKGLTTKRRRMAIDLSEICYYGQPMAQERELRRGKRKDGTTRFHCYGTLYVVHHGMRYTVAMTYVWKDDAHAAVVQRLLERAKKLKVTPKILLLDRGFYAMDVVQYLKSVECPFLMPVVHRGRKSKRPLDQLKGTRRFLAWKKSGFSEHLMDNRKEQTRVHICVRCGPFRKRRKRANQPHRKSASKPQVFAFWGFRARSAAQLAETYRKRFGIESSYRQMNQGRMRTCSRDPRLRLLMVGIALILRNVWVLLHQIVFGRIRGRGIELHLEKLRLRTLWLMLQHYAEELLGLADDLQDADGQEFAACV